MTVRSLIIYDSPLIVFNYYADIWHPFDPIFIKPVKSHYRDEWLFRTANNQISALALCDDEDINQEASNHVGLMPNNPLHLPDFWLAGIETLTYSEDVLHNK